MKVVCCLKVFLLFFCISLKSCSPYAAAQMPLVSFARLEDGRIQAEKNNGSGMDQSPDKEKVQTSQEQLQKFLQSYLPKHCVGPEDVEEIERRHRCFTQEQLRFVAESINPEEFADSIEYQRTASVLAAFTATSGGNAVYANKQMLVIQRAQGTVGEKLQSTPLVGDTAYRHPALSAALVSRVKHRWGQMGINSDNVHLNVDYSKPGLNVRMDCAMHYKYELCGNEKLPVVKRFSNASFWLNIGLQSISWFEQNPRYADEQLDHEGRHLKFGDGIILNVLLSGLFNNQKGLQEVASVRRLQEYAASVPLRGDDLRSIRQLVDCADQLARGVLPIGQQCLKDGYDAIHPELNIVARAGQSLLNYVEKKADDDVGQGLGHVIKPEFSYNGRTVRY